MPVLSDEAKLEKFKRDVKCTALMVDDLPEHFRVVKIAGAVDVFVQEFREGDSLAIVRQFAIFVAGAGYKGIKETCELQTEVGDERAKSARNTLRVMAQMMVAGELYSDLFVYPNCETP